MITRLLKTLLRFIFRFVLGIIFLLTLYLLYNVNLFHSPKKLSEKEIKQYLSQIDSAHSDPYSFVAEKFDDHDIVFLGELHKRKQDLEFLNNLIPYLYKHKKIKYIGWEFGAQEFQASADSLVNAADFDRKKAIAIMRNSYFSWCYEEYLTVFKTIWSINKEIANPDDRIKFLQLNKTYIPKLFESDDPKIRFKERQVTFDNLAPTIIEHDIIQNNEKILVYCGLHHALTKFKTPVMFWKKDNSPRFGQILFEKYPDKIFQIVLISPFMPKWTTIKALTDSEIAPYVYPFQAVFNQVYDTLKKPFAVNSSVPYFSSLRDYQSFYAFDTWNGITLREFCDGAIMINSFDKIDPVHYIQDWISTQQEVDEIKKTLPDQDALKIHTVQDMINYMDPELNFKGLKEFHHLKKFW